MTLVVNISTFILVASCFVHLCISVPVNTKNKDDPCGVEDFKNIPTCGVNDEKCIERNEKKREKRQTLCEENPSCGFCGTPMTDGESAEGIVLPEIVDPIDITSNSTDEEFPQKKLIERNIIIENDNETQYYRGYVESAANITTVIRLTNLINNTNIINMPTTLNNTNINNIHVYQNHSSSEGGKYGLGYTDKGSCCHSVQPKNCRQSTAGMKCRHKRQKVCGHQCTRKVIHANSHRSPCVQIPQWPYTQCPQNNPPGFNQGYNPGSYQPPFYPNYPPQGYPGYPPQGYPSYPPQNPKFDFDDEDDEDDFPVFPNEEELENPENGWLISPEKCKVVSDDGLQIKNCTNQGLDFDHPFARNTVNEPSKRRVRQANHHVDYPQYQNQMPQQGMPMFYPMMYQPVYVQPMPIYMPQYYAPPPPIASYYQNQQISAPPVVSYESEEESDEIIPQQKRKHVKKHHPIVMEVDEEL